MKSQKTVKEPVKVKETFKKKEVVSKRVSDPAIK